MQVQTAASQAWVFGAGGRSAGYSTDDNSSSSQGAPTYRHPAGPHVHRRAAASHPCSHAAAGGEVDCFAAARRRLDALYRRRAQRQCGAQVLSLGVLLQVACGGASCSPGCQQAMAGPTTAAVGRRSRAPRFLAKHRSQPVLGARRRCSVDAAAQRRHRYRRRGLPGLQAGGLQRCGDGLR